MTTLTESTVESVTQECLTALGRQAALGLDIDPDTPGAESGDYGQAVLERRRRDAIALLNQGMRASAGGL